ncbi:MAG: CD225/dispanin family protein [Humibacillus sp.]|nr:CD225/dispanin family protein [Humibacillus sp.]
MTDPHDRSASRLPQADGPDPDADAWSAWLPPLEPTSDATGADAGATGPRADLGIPPMPPPPGPPAVPPAPTRAHQTYPAYVVAPPPPNGQWGVAPPTHLALAIVSMVIGSLPFGIVATVKASRVQVLFIEGKVAEAHRVSRQARTWAITAFVVNAAWIFLLVLVPLALGRR